jgi:DNA helicase-4
MTKMSEQVIEATALMQRLYDSGKYVSYSSINSIEYTYPSIWEVFRAFPEGRGVFLDMLSCRRHLKKYTSHRYRVDYNNGVIKDAQKKPFLIEGKPLDTQQIEAVVVTEDAQLVMAAAGSGKTLSLLAKCTYLVEELHIPAERILTVSFTNSSASELAERLQKLNITVEGKTFHALGNDILGKGTFRTIQQSDQTQLIKTIIAEKSKTDETFARRYNDYLLNYFTVPTLPIDAHSLEQLVQSNRSFNTTTLKQVSLDKRDYSIEHTSYQGEKVRSKEEQIIANFLYINNIPYTYEKPFPGYAGYKPDFTITQFSEPIYLEHQGIDRNSKTRKDIDWKYYQRKIQWNRNYHDKGGTRLIETFSYEFQEGTILQVLEERLKAQGVEIVRRQESEILTLIRSSYSFDVMKLNELFITYLGLLKTSEYTLADIRDKLKSTRNTYQVHRSRAFLALFEDIYAIYDATLRASGSIDFSDMIVAATTKLETLPAGSFEYDYILVDEVQDLSFARYRLIKTLLDRVPNAKLFTVGDDWQSIFRFAGSDLTLINDFEKRFGRHTYHSTIEQTHRFSNPLLDISSQFVKRNPSQIKKNPYSLVQSPTSLTINETATKDSDATALGNELQALVDTYGADEVARRSIFIIGRYKRDLLRIDNIEDQRMQFRQLDETGTSIQWTDTRSGFQLTIPFLTMHSAKGQTCDHAFILNASGGSLGLPSVREDDPVIHMLLAHEDSFPNAEERRLFYVALTRAKHSTTIITQANNTSPFLDELNMTNAANDKSEELRCPACHSGRLIPRKGPTSDFLGCTNYGYGCTYSQNFSHVR